MSSEVRIEFVDGHADVWRLFDDPVQLREIAHRAHAWGRPRPREAHALVVL